MVRWEYIYDTNLVANLLLGVRMKEFFFNWPKVNYERITSGTFLWTTLFVVVCCCCCCCCCKLPNVFEFADVVDLDNELVMIALLELVEVSLRRFQQHLVYTYTH